MRKYIEIARVLFKAQLVYRFDMLANMVFTVAKILLAYVLWNAIFAGRDTVAGFTLPAMLTYYIVGAFLNGLDQSGGTGNEIAARIRGGTFSRYMVVPVNVFSYFTAQTLGVSVFLAGFHLAATACWVALFRIPLTFGGTLTDICYAVALVLLGLLFMVQFENFIGIWAFKLQNVWLLNMVKYSIVELISGSLIPLTLLPAGILAVLRWLPFYHVLYLPSMLIIGRNSNEALFGVVMLIAWNVVFLPLNHLTYQRLRVQYDGVGI